jgi:uncharacterized protein DUF6221
MGRVDDLIAFVRARLDEDEAAAKAWLPLVRLDGSGSWYDEVSESNLGPYSIEHARLHDPARALRDVAAGRRILERHSPAEGIAVAGPCCTWCSDDTDTVSLNAPWPCPDVLDLLSRWDDHPDYRVEWKP